jgi:glycolate oxidase
MLEDSVYEVLKQTVGEDNITRDPGILDTYAFQWGEELYNAQPGKKPNRFGQRPLAVVLPKSTEEVQAIIRVCNEHDLKFKALSTGLGRWAGVSSPHAIQIDLRRMNRILEVDAKNMYAVIEPYVTNAELQSELFKYGLMHHAQGAGPQTSPLASHTSFVGPGFTSPHTGYSARNVLGVEWVLPDGAILRLGSFDHNGKWFSGDGPGPSLRGVMRGWLGTYGGLGVFTKCAIRLYSWPAQKEWKWRTGGTIPNYEWDIPNYWKIYVLNFENWDTYQKAYYEISDRELAMIATTSAAEGLAVMFTNTKTDAINAIMAGLLAKIKKYIIVLLAAHTQREFEFRTKLLKFITEKYGGKDLVETGVIKPKPMHYGEAVRNMLGAHAFRFSNCFQSTHGGMDTISMAVKIAQLNKPIKQKYIKKHVIGDDRGEGIWMTSYEGGHMAHLEAPTVYNPTSAESCSGYTEYQDESNKMDFEQALGMPFFVVGEEVHNYYADRTMNYPNWLRKIKNAFDPKGASDSGFYITGETKEK